MLYHLLWVIRSATEKLCTTVIKYALLATSASFTLVLPSLAFADTSPTPSTEDIVVTATGLKHTQNDTTTPVITMSGDELVHRRQATLGDTLGGQPGIHFDNFSGGASRPVIRGQSSPRVQALSDGASVHDASAISPDHAIATEPLLLRGIEILRGPATLLYGGSAIGGAINMLDEKVPTAIPQGGLEGMAEARLGTADHERSFVGGITAGIGPIALRLEGVHRKTDDYRVPNSFGYRRVEGSFNENNTLTAGLSWIGDGGYLGFSYTRQRNSYGLPSHNHTYEDCHTHDLSLACHAHRDEHDDHDDHDHEHGHDGHHDEIPFIKMRRDRFDIRSEYADPLPGIENFRFRMGITNYKHDEIAEGEPSTTFRNKAYELRAEFTHKPIGGFRGVFGIQHSGNDFSVDGLERSLAPSETYSTALFLMETLDLGAVRLEAALRQEWQTIETLSRQDAKHRPFSASAAAIWRFDNAYSLSLSLSRSQRAPNVQELFSNMFDGYNGAHFATNTWELGNPALRTETAHTASLTFRKTKGATTFTLGVYRQDFRNYIYAETLDSFEDFRLIRYTANDATFTGIDGEIKHTFSPTLSASIFGDYVRAKLKGGEGNLPRIPAGRLGGRVDAKWGDFSADAEYYRVFAQNHTTDFETRTKGYNMLNATLAYHFDVGPSVKAEVFLRATNLANALAYNHPSFIKDNAPLRGRNFTLGLRTNF